jgi:hypothetical protein
MAGSRWAKRPGIMGSRTHSLWQDASTPLTTISPPVVKGLYRPALVTVETCGTQHVMTHKRSDALYVPRGWLRYVRRHVRHSTCSAVSCACHLLAAVGICDDTAQAQHRSLEAHVKNTWLTNNAFLHHQTLVTVRRVKPPFSGSRMRCPGRTALERDIRVLTVLPPCAATGTKWPAVISNGCLIPCSGRGLLLLLSVIQVLFGWQAATVEVSPLCLCKAVLTTGPQTSVAICRVSAFTQCMTYTLLVAYLHKHLDES